MGFFSWKTADTKRSIPNSSSKRFTGKSVYLLQPGGKPPIEEACYEGYGCFGGVDAYVWLAENNLPTHVTSEMGHAALREAGIAIDGSGIVFRDTSTGKFYTIFHSAPFLSKMGVDVTHLGVLWNTKVEAFGGLSPNEAREQGRLQDMAMSALITIQFPLKFSFNKNARYESLRPSETCEFQGYFYD